MGNLARAYREPVLWPLIVRDEQGIVEEAVASLGLVRGKGEYVVFESLTEAFAQVSPNELLQGIRVSVRAASRWGEREAALSG